MKRPILTAVLALASFPQLSLMAADEAEPPAPKASASERERRMEEVARERAAKMERDRILGEHHLNLGRELKTGNRLEEAAEAFRTAVSLMPDSAEAVQELRDIESTLGHLPGRREKALDELGKAHRAAEDEKTVSVQHRIGESRRLMAEQRFTEALQALREAQETVRWMAFGSPDQERLRAEVNAMTKEAQRHALEEEVSLKERQRLQAAVEAQKDYEAMRLQKQRRVAALRSQGNEALKAERWMDAEHVAAELDDLLPGDSGAANLKALARERRHVSTRYGLKGTYAEEDRNTREAAKESQIPFGYGPEGSVRFPEDWDRVQARADSMSQVEQVDADPPWKQQLRGKLASTVHFKLPDLTFKDAKEYFEKELLKSPIVVDNLAKEKDPGLDEKPISMESPEQGMSLQSALTHLAHAVSLEWTLKEEAVLFTTAEGLAEPNVLKDYDVHDLLVAIQDFIGPTIGMGGGGAGGPGIVFDKTADAAEDEKITGESLMELIKEQIDNKAKDLWTNQGASVQFRNGKLFVNGPPSVHKQVQSLLSKLRDNRTLQVMIQARFIQLIDASVEGLGVDWTGLTETAGTVSAGFTNPRGLRTQIEAGTSNNAANFINTGTFPRTFNGSLTNAPTTVMSVAFLDNFQAQALITAVEKSGKGNILTAPTLLCFNTQRANMVSVTQYAYIQDITAVVQVQAVAYDPEIGYVQTGIVFDVRPVVSADRKYITLELRPTVSELKTIRTVFTSGAITTQIRGLQQNTFVEAPVVNMSAIRTTVSVPDGGTLLIGGLTNYDQTHNQTGTPFLSKIPFLSALFSAREDAHNRNSLVILVKAQIVDQREIENDRFGRD